jgi:hypothetical protein
MKKIQARFAESTWAALHDSEGHKVLLLQKPA